MPAISFTNLAMLGGLVALSVPIIIHLLLRRKRKRVRFSTVQFFLKQDEQASHRRKLRNWLLLALRLAICALLVLAFARPYLQDGGAAAAAQRKRQVLVLLDRSLSIQANASDGPKWLRAREAARQIVSELKPDDRAALIGCGVRAEVLSEWAPAAVVSKTLAEIEPTCGAATLVDGLREANRLLSLGEPGAATTLCIISDLQRTACENLASSPLPQKAEIRVINVGELVTPNLAVTDLQLGGNDGTQPRAVLASFSDEDVPELKLEVSIDGRVTSTKMLALAAGSSTNVELSVPPLRPGWHDLAVQLHAKDALALDDVRYQTVLVPEPSRAWVVESRPGKRSFEEESFFVTAALDPSKDSTNGIPSRFTFEKLSADELAGRLTSARNPARCDLVILPGLKQVPSALGNALTSYVQAGGGMLFFLGDGVSANRYNAEFRGLLPTQLERSESSPDPELPWRIGQYSTNLAVFSPFLLPNSGDLSLARFTNRFALRAGESNSVGARFDDGTPFLLLQQVGRGQVVLVNTSADTTWNDWPKHKTFVPWLHATAEYLARLNTRNPSSAQANLLAGTDDDLDLGAAAAGGIFKVQAAGGKELTVKADEQGRVRDLTLAKPGVYSLRDGKGIEVRRLAVNVPAGESDLAALAGTQFEQRLARSAEEKQASLAAGLFGPGSNQRELWRVLLLSALALLLVELWLANRTLA
jgi:hypothetical protein